MGVGVKQTVGAAVKKPGALDLKARASREGRVFLSLSFLPSLVKDWGQ